MSTPGMDWSTDSAGWPHREASTFIEAGGLRWHVQRWPLHEGPAPLHPEPVEGVAAQPGLRQAQPERVGTDFSSSPAGSDHTAVRTEVSEGSVHPEPVEGPAPRADTEDPSIPQGEREAGSVRPEVSKGTDRPEPVEGPEVSKGRPTPEAETFKRPLALLLHGTGASTHSWRDIAPLLAQHFRVLAIDLPGHAFTGMPAAGAASPQMSLPGMAQAVSQLLRELDERPALVVGHSAGAAVAVRMALDGLIKPRLIVGLNAALLPLRGLAGQVFSPVAKLMAGSTLVPKLFARHASDPAVARRLLDSTGSHLDERGLALYGRLVSNAGHATGALAMMANWDLQTLAGDLHRLSTPLALVVGTQDRTVRPAQAERVAALMPPDRAPSITRLPGLGHLAHEERPVEVAALIETLFGGPQART